MPRNNAAGGADVFAPWTKRSTSRPKLRLVIVHHWPYASAPKRTASSARDSRSSLLDGRGDPERGRIGDMAEVPGLLRSSDAFAADRALNGKHKYMAMAYSVNRGTGFPSRVFFDPIFHNRDDVMIPFVLRCGARAARHRTGRPLSIELPHP